MSDRLNKHGQNEMYDEFGNIIMGKESPYIQYQECTLKNMISLLCELFGPSVSQESRLSHICSEDVNNLDIIKDGIEKRFGVCITSADIVKSANVGEFTDRVAKLIESPRFPISEKEQRRDQLAEIAYNNSLKVFIGELVNAGKKLKESKDEIKKIEAPINLLGHHYKNSWINDILDATDVKVGRDELRKVVLEIDKNTKDAVTSLGNAIDCTNKWIDEICKMLIWIIQIENDIYGIAEESSNEALRIGKLLSQEGASINGLTEVAAIEQSKRRRIQQKVKEFKSDIEGKIGFLNDVHKSLLSQFEEHKKHIQTEIDFANKALEQKVGDYISNIDKKFSELCTETTNSFQQLQQTLKEEEGKRIREFDGMKSEQKDFVEKTRNDFQKEIDTANKALEQRVGDYFSDLDNKFSKLHDGNKANFQQLQQTLKEEEGKRSREFDGMKSEQKDFVEKTKNDFQKEIDTANKALEQRVGDYISNIDKKFSELCTETTNNFQQLQQTLKEEEGIRSREFDEMKSEQKDFVEKTKNDFQKEIDTANKALEQRVGDCFSDLDNKFSKLRNENTNNFQQLQQTLKDDEGKRSREFEEMKLEQKGFAEKTQKGISGINETTSVFIKEQSAVIEKLQKRTKLYKVISFTTFVVSIAALLFALLN